MAERTSLRDYQRKLAERLRGGQGHRATSKLGVRVGTENWMVDLADAGEIIPVPPVTPVPLTRPWFKGMTNIRGNLYCVVDFSAFLGGAPAPITDQSRLLLIGGRFRTGSALLIDRSLGLRDPAQLRE
ncbi:MAG: chemotaxis protein CheW, partial [bacterium]